MARLMGARAARWTSAGCKKITGRCEWPTTQKRVSKAAKFGAAASAEVRYSQIGLDGLPWASVKSPTRVSSGSDFRYVRSSCFNRSRVQIAELAAAALKSARSRRPTAAQSWLPEIGRAHV